MKQVYAQPMLQWASQYTRTANSPGLANYLALDKLGNSYMCGTIFNSVTRNDVILVKYNSGGDTLWTRRYNNNNNEDFPEGIVCDSLGNVYVECKSGVSGNLNDFVTLKYSSSGVLLWTRIYGYPGADQAPLDIKMDKTGNIYVTGTSGTAASAITIKYNTNGDSLWVRVKTEPGYHYYGVALGFDGNNNVYTAIIKNNDITNNDFFLVVKYDTNGNEQWTATHNPNSGFDLLACIAVDNAGDSFIGCVVSTLGYVTIKFNTSGVEQWTRTYTNGNGEVLNSIRSDAGGNCYVTGATSNGGSNYDYLTIKYNPNGDSLWVRRYDGPGHDDDEANDMFIDDSSNVYITGQSVGGGPGWDYATIKYNTHGVQQWVLRYLHGRSYAIALDAQRNIYITGRVADSLTGLPAYGTLKYSQPPVGILPVGNSVPESYNLFQNYPNPFNPSTKIKFHIATVGQRHVHDPAGGAFNTRLIVYDILGKEVATLVNEQLLPGEYEISFDASNFPSGIYFYRIETGNFTDSKKMVIVK